MADDSYRKSMLNRDQYEGPRNDDPEAHRAPPAPRTQRAATGMSSELQLCCAKLRAEGFDVCNASVLLEQDRELERYRVADAAGGHRVHVADLEDERDKALELAGVLTIYAVRSSQTMGTKTRETFLNDLDHELGARGLRRPVEPLIPLEAEPGRLFDIAAKLRQLEDLKRRVLELEAMLDALGGKT